MLEKITDMQPRSGAALVAVIVAGAVLALVYGVFLAAPAVGTFHDDGIYLVTGQALAEGRGYRIVSVPGEPFQNKYPVLFPWLLSLAWRLHPVFPDNLVLLRMVPLAAALGWLGVSWALLRRLGTPATARMLMLLLVAASPWLVFLSTMLLAETVFAALLTAGVLAIVRIDAGEGRRFEGLLAGALMGAALLTRAAGVAPVAAGLIALVLGRRWRVVPQYLGGVLLLAGPWFWWVATHASQPTLDGFYDASTYGDWNILTHFSWREKIDVLTVNALYAARLGHYWALPAQGPIGALATVLGSALVLRGLWVARRSPVSLLVVLNVGMTLLYVWPPVRYIVPVLPLIVWLAWVGAGRFRPHLALLALVLLASAGLELRTLSGLVRERGATSFSVSEGWVFDWRAMRPQIDWIARHAPPDAVLATIHDPTYYLFTGRQAMRPFTFDQLGMHYSLRDTPVAPFGTVDDLRRRLRVMTADYVVVTRADQLQPLVEALAAADPGSLAARFGDPASGYVVYEVRRDRLRGD